MNCALLPLLQEKDMFNDFMIQDRFWSEYQALVQKVMLPYQYHVLNDSLPDPDIEKSHSFENFRIAAGLTQGEFYGFVFQDSDTAKWLEAVAYTLMFCRDDELEHQADEIIRLVAAAQQPDGYLNTCFTIRQPEDKWKNLGDWHELYCAGHLIEAGIAYYEATGKDTLLSVVLRLADLICSIFGKGKRYGLPGHPEIELALMKLYRLTGNEQYRETASFFIDERGRQPDFFDRDKEAHGITSKGMDARYYQMRTPLRLASAAEGHAVRAVYLYTGAAMTAKANHDSELLSACVRLWKNIVDKQMYLTGGIGSSQAGGETFTLDYDLPNDSAYAETCASIGLLFFSHEPLTEFHDASYADLMERILYNVIPASIQRDGTRFLYTNPLSVNPDFSGKVPILAHIAPSRFKWHSCACCPPNTARMIASLNRYCWHRDGMVLYSDLLISGYYQSHDGIRIRVEGDYPLGAELRYSVHSNFPFRLAIRIPAWSAHTVIELNGTELKPELCRGYAILPVSSGDCVRLRLDMAVRLIYANPKVEADIGRCALMRGPMVYCFEDEDNGDINRLSLLRDGNYELTPISSEDGLGDYIQISLHALSVCPLDSSVLYSTEPPQEEKCSCTAIPYYLWGNRHSGKMRVWMPYR